MRLLGLALLLAGCSGDGAPANSGLSADPLDGGWVETVAMKPAAFAEVVSDQSRAGWIALHANRYQEAAAHGEPVVTARAQEALAVLNEDLARLSHLTWQRTFTEWESRSGIPEGSAIPLVAALDALDAGDAEAGKRWLQSAHPAEAGLASFASRLGQGIEAAATGQEPQARCLALQLAARASGQIESLGDCGEAPFAEGDAGQHTLYDPLIYRTLATAWRAGIVAAPRPPASLPSLLFSASWNQADLSARQAGSTTMGAEPTLVALGIQSNPPEKEDPQWARERVRALDRALDEWGARLAQQAPAEGQSLLSGLDLIAGYRSRLLVDWTRAALLADRPHEALATAQLALDVEHGREVGPKNPPSLFVVLAEANLRTGRTREALDALRPLVEPYPYVHGLTETVGDLAILEGMGRQGDSKEH